MKLSQLILATLALGATAAPNPEAKCARDLEARDAAPEPATMEEFDVRSPEEDEILAHDEDIDIAARTWHKKCGWGAYYKHHQCYCYRKNYYYDDGHCQKKCHHDATYKHEQCVCPHGYEYSHHWGCKKRHY